MSLREALTILDKSYDFCIYEKEDGCSGVRTELGHFPVATAIPEDLLDRKVRVVRPCIYNRDNAYSVRLEA